MNEHDLPNKPLVEAILEVRWKLENSPQPGLASDPYYHLLPGRLQERLSDKYPAYQALPTTRVPDELVPYVAQHQFRATENGWPLVQLGPGVLTVNHTEDYRWPTFLERATSAVATLFDTYPEPAKLEVDYLVLRYIDAVALGADATDVLTFLSDKMRVHLDLPSRLFDQYPVSGLPNSLNCQLDFPLLDGKAVAKLRFATGKRFEQDALIWETVIMSTAAQVPSGLPDSLVKWLEDAHTVADGWFFTLIEGELERRFRGE